MESTGDARERVLELAMAEGFGPVRIAPAAPLLAAREAALRARAEGRLDGLAWMTDEWLERATNPHAFLAGVRSLVIVALPYAPNTGHGASQVVPTADIAPAGQRPTPNAQQPARQRPTPNAQQPTRGRIAAYAQGRDYHRVFEKKLRRFARSLREELGAQARPTVDYGPLLERPLAALAGMGWLGKSTMLLVPGAGPWVLLGAVVTDLALEPDLPLRKSCGSCARCIVACPTGALAPDGHVLDARRCISYHTIENRGPIPRELRPRFGDWVFGCDACLDACPVGAHHAETHPDFAPVSIESARPDLAGILALDEAAFAERYRGRAIMRAKRDGLVRNACIALGNVGTPRDVPALEGALDDGAPLVRGHAAWALGELARRWPASAHLARCALAARLACEQDAWVREELALALEALPGGDDDGHR